MIWFSKLLLITVVHSRGILHWDFSLALNLHWSVDTFVDWTKPQGTAGDFGLVVTVWTAGAMKWLWKYILMVKKKKNEKKTVKTKRQFLEH